MPEHENHMGDRMREAREAKEAKENEKPDKPDRPDRPDKPDRNPAGFNPFKDNPHDVHKSAADEALEGDPTSRTPEPTPKETPASTNETSKNTEARPDRNNNNKSDRRI